MTKERLPQLTEAHIRKLTRGPSFERGKNYYRDGAVLEPLRQGLELRAECAGSEYEPYQVRVRLGPSGIKETSCTCPYDQGGLCKHIVALLLTYVHQPQALRIVSPLKTMLAGRSPEELMALIEEMIKREPQLLSVVELSVAKQQVEQGQLLDVSTYRRQARRALQHDNPRAIERELKTLRDTAARLAKSGDWLNAGAVYHVLLEEAVRGYSDLLSEMDENGDLAILVDEFAQGLSQSLKQGQAASATRQAWLETLLEAELTDIELGGIDLAPSAYEAILKQANDEEWARIEQRVRAALPKSREWTREALVELLVRGQKRRGRASAATALIREMGTPEQQVFLLVKEKQIAQALGQMRQILKSKPGLAIQFADALVQAKANKAAVELVAERAGAGNSWCVDWLARYYRQHGSSQEALEWQEKVFLQQPSVKSFKELREVSHKQSQWEQVRARALTALEREKKIGALLEIALEEKDVARALELLPRVERQWGWGRNYKSEVAQAAEKSYPQAALALYRELAERAIGERQRSSYQTAAQHLKRMKRLYERLKAPSDWAGYLQVLRTKYANLPALQDELRKARL